MIWGCMTAHGVGYMCRIEGRMDAELYEEILEDHLFQTMRYYKMDKHQTIFQQDNDPKRTSKQCQKWFKDKKVQLLDQPAQSPDLNPIEHLWQHLKFCLAQYEKPPISIHELWDQVEVEWEKIAQEDCAKLIESMPRRVAAVLKAKGGYTKY